MKFENNNKEVIKRITKRSLKENKVRNIFAVLAIILTTFMISSVFSIGVSFVKNNKIMNLRLDGSTANISLANPSNEQIEKIESLDLAKSIGYEILAGRVTFDSLEKSRANIFLKYSDAENFKEQMTPSIGDIKGVYPTRENEVMVSRKALELLGKESSKIGEKLKIPCNINGKVIKKEFIITGIYTTYGVVQDTGNVLVSKKFIDINKLSIENSGKLLMTLKKASKSDAADILDSEISLKDRQKFVYSYDRTEELSETMLITACLVLAIVFFIILSGYLLIYNVLYIAVIKDINFYGLLKTIGASPRQIKKIVKGQARRLSIIGIPIGLLLGGLTSFVIVPFMMKSMIINGSEVAMPSDVSFNPIIFILAGLFSLLTVAISSRKPAKIAGDISPTEALNYTGVTYKKQKKNRNSTRGGKLYKMAWYNVFRDKKRAVVVFLSLFMGVITFLSIHTFSNSISVEYMINKSVKDDFLIQNIEEEGSKIDDNLISDIKAISGIEEISSAKSSILQIEMNEDILLPSINEIHDRFGYSSEEVDKLLKSIEKDTNILKTSVIGIDNNRIDRFKSESGENFDVEAFKKGELAFISLWYYPQGHKINDSSLNISDKDNKDSKNINVQIIEDLYGFLPSGRDTVMGVSPIYVSMSVLEKLDNKAIYEMLYIDVDKKYELQIESDLKKISEVSGFWFESKSDKTQEFIKTQMVMNILGGGISTILILIGLLNFINIMITGVNIRLQEFAVMESIGMTKKQVEKMLTFEGGYYAGITTLILATLGSLIIYLVGKASQRIYDYVSFEFPIIPMIMLTILIFAVCLIAPAIIFRISSKKSITERIRGTES